jgi:hypothetical protein
VPWFALTRALRWQCRPFTIALYRVVRVLSTPPGGKLSAAPFHALNVALHAGACLGRCVAAAQALVSQRNLTPDVAGVTAQVHALTAHLASLAGHPDVALCATVSGARARVSAMHTTLRP